MRRKLVASLGLVAVAAGGLFAAIGITQDGEPTVATETFTNVVTYTIPTVTETVTVTGTTEPPSTTTEPPPTTTEPPPTTTEPEPTGTLRPGQSWDAAYKAASPGDVILVADGNHGTQRFTHDSSKAGPDRVTFRGLGGATLVDLDFRASHIAVENVDVGERWYVYPGASNLLLKDVTAERFYIRCGQGVTVEGGTLTDPVATGVPTISAGGGQTIASWARAACPDDAAPSRNIVLDGVTFRDIWRPQGDSTSHRECLHVMGVIGLTVRGGLFHGCLGNTSAVSFNIHHSSRIEGVVFDGGTIEDTYQSGAYPQPTGTGPSVNISDRAPGYEITFRNYHFRDGSAVVPQGSPTYPGAIRFEDSTFAGPKPSGLRASSYVWANNTYNAG